MTRRRRLAYFSPLPPARTGIADHAIELLPALARQADITLYSADPPAAVDARVTEQYTVHSLAAYGMERWNYDAAIFHMGNSYFHEGLYQTFCHYPGIVVLHDLSLHHLMVERSQHDGNYVRYRRELAYALGQTGIQIGQDFRHGRRELSLYEWPLNERVIDLSLGLVTHSHYAAAKVQQRRPELLVRVIPQPKIMRPAAAKRSIPGWPDDALVFMSAGQVTPSRQLDLVLRAFADVQRSCPQVRYLIVGEWRHPGLSLEQLLQDLQLQEVVRHIGFVENLTDFDDWIASADVLVNVRYPTVGETSAVVLRALAAGVPVVVWNDGWYSELPETCCVKVPSQDLRALTAALHHLAFDGESRRQLGEQAALYARQTFDPERVAAQYIAFVDECMTRWMGSSDPIQPPSNRKS